MAQHQSDQAPDPLPLGPFDVEQDGILALREQPARAKLQFEWRGRACEAALTPEGMRMGAVAGRVPSTASLPMDREPVFSALRSLRPELPLGWRLGLTADHRIRIEADTAVRTPASPVTLIAALVGFAMALDPYLDRLEAAGAESLPLSPVTRH
ncbi:hypothetical protein IAI18_17930 [Acetobacteraceae bacterium H6797]|nr:hypothetical protein [Acetobacteraceae bacterium H6797]